MHPRATRNVCTDSELEIQLPLLAIYRQWNGGGDSSSLIGK